MCAYSLNSVIVGRFPGNRSCDCLVFAVRHSGDPNHLILGGPGPGLSPLFLTLWRMLHLSCPIQK